MKPEEQRIAIAEACGWKDVMCRQYFSGKLTGVPPTTSGLHHEVPDYLNDLNAMHEAEKGLPKDLMGISFWLDNLYRANGLNPYIWRNGTCSDKTDPTPPVEMALITKSTASQRAEAFLKTLNLWI